MPSASTSGTAWATLAWDRDRRAGLYARSGIPLTWVVDLDGAEVPVDRDRSADGYQVTERARRASLPHLPGPEVVRPDGYQRSTVSPLW